MAHQWRFFRSGGFDQVKLDRIEDWQHLAELDPKLWAALSCPVQGLELDRRTLDYLDADRDGRVRIDEVKTAVQWAIAMLQTPDVLLTATELPLAAINQQHSDGQKLFASARRLLANLGKPDATALSVEDTADLTLIFPAHQYNGDGIVTVELANHICGTDSAAARLIATLLELGIQSQDRSGACGISQAQLETFVAEAQALLAWQQAGSTVSTILGEHTAAIFPLVQALDAKINDYFIRCQLAAYDQNAAAALNASCDDYAVLSRQLLSNNSSDSSYLPLAHVSSAGLLPLQQGLHPHWAAQVSELAHYISDWHGKTSINIQDWQWLKTTLQPFSDWQAQQPTTAVASIAASLLAECLDEAALQQTFGLIADDLAQQTEAESVLDVDKLIRYQRYLRDLLRNFVSFEHFYNLKQPAIFQNGRLYMDGRSCDLCLTVNDAGKHAKLAGLSGMYLLYLDCIRACGEKKSVVAAMTAGDAGNLMVGRNGVYYDRDGKDWDVTVTQIVANPISIREAFFTPYQRIGRMISEQIQKFAAAKDKDIETKSAGGIGDASQIAAAPAAKPAVPFDVAKFAGIFAAIGLAIGAIGTALAAVVTSFLGLLWWQMPLALLGILLFISGPSMVLAWFKLRARNIAPLLDANGWAVNTNAKLSIKFGTQLTELGALPSGSSRALTDPFEHKSQAKWWIVAVIVAVVIWVFWRQGLLTQFLPG